MEERPKLGMLSEMAAEEERGRDRSTMTKQNLISILTAVRRCRGVRESDNSNFALFLYASSASSFSVASQMMLAAIVLKKRRIPELPR